MADSIAGLDARSFTGRRHHRAVENPPARGMWRMWRIQGGPAIRMDPAVEVVKRLRRLKRLFDDLAGLKKTVTDLSHKG